MNSEKSLGTREIGEHTVERFVNPGRAERYTCVKCNLTAITGRDKINKRFKENECNE
jgi:hypothetical protein